MDGKEPRDRGKNILITKLSGRSCKKDLTPLNINIRFR